FRIVARVQEPSFAIHRRRHCGHHGTCGTARAYRSVRRVHDRITGFTPSGEAYCANDPELLNWVHGTAAYGFAQAFHAYVKRLSLLERNCYYGEGDTAAALTVPQGHRHLKPSLKCYFRHRPAVSSVLILFLNSSPSCVRHQFCRCFSSPFSGCLCERRSV